MAISAGCQNKPDSNSVTLPSSLSDALSNGKPTLADFGSSSCIPCKEMQPILTDLAAMYSGRLNVVIIDVYEQEALTSSYHILGIPTQVIFDSSGKEVTRHVGSWPLASIVTKLKELGLS